MNDSFFTLRWRKGSITVFLCIVLAVLIPLCGILIDLVRYNEAKKMAESSLKVCAESMLAAYDTQLKEQFGLFAMYPREDSGSMEKEMYELLSDNLTPENAEGKVTDLYGFKVNRIEVIPIYNYSEPYVIEQQIAEFMKYRAPVQMIGEFLEKLKAMTGLMKEGDMVEKNMNIDKMLNNLRENMIYLSLLMELKMKKINEMGNDADSVTTYTILAIKKANEDIVSCEPKEERIADINNFHSAYIASLPALEQAEADLKPIADALSSLNSQMDSVKSRINAEMEELENENKKENPDTSSIDAVIESLQTQLKSLEEDYASTSSAYDAAAAKVTEARNVTDQALNSMKSNAETVKLCYRNMCKLINDIVPLLERLQFELELHINHCSKSVELANAIIPQANEIQNEKNTLERDMKDSPDSSVSGRISADLEKKMLTVDTDKLIEIISQVDNDKKQLEDWLKDVLTAKDAYNAASEGLDGELKKLEGLSANPGDASIVIDRFSGCDGIEAIRITLAEEIRNYDTYPVMLKNNIYLVPDYVIEPLPADKEKSGFEIWYQNTFHEANLKPEEEKDDGALDKAKGSLGGTTKEIATQEIAVDGQVSLEDIINAFGIEGILLPSKGGRVSSAENLIKISGEVANTQQEQSVNPLEASPQGYGDKVDEKQKNFFDYELERIRKLLETVVNLLKNTGESLVKSLYMNEYIVSAFKNYTTKDNKLEYDIGWDRPLDKTYFQKGEVEYVLFGNFSEKDNLSASKRSIFAIRLIFNLLHVYTDPGKVSATLEIATTIAGWTIFGVPIVQNLLLIGWAAAESWIDAGLLMDGKKVPLVKTTQSWFLDLNTLKNYLLGQLKLEITDAIQEKVDNLIDEGATYVEDTVSSFIDAQVDAVFSKVETEWKDASVKINDGARSLVNSIPLPDFSKFPTDTLDHFLESVKGYIADQVGSFCSQIEKQGQDFIAECKAAIKEKIRAFIFGSPVYQKLKSDIKQYADDVIKKGVGAASDKLVGMLGGSGGASSNGNNVMGRLIMMDYTDYLRLMLLAVPEETKALRVADLIQMDMYKASSENSKPLSRYHTAFYVKAYIDMNTWFLPESLFKKENDGMIVIEWSMGY